MMNLTVNNIKHVVEHTVNGYSYGWFVAMKSNKVSDSRNFINYKGGKTTNTIEYPAEKLPKSVQKFITRHERREREEFGIVRGSEDTYKSYIYSA